MVEVTLGGRGRLSIGVLALVLAVILAACASDADPDATDPDETDLVTIQMGHNVAADLILYYMKTNPEFATNLGEVYDIEWTGFSGVAPAVQALAAGTIDGATVSALASANALNEGVELLIFGQTITEKEGYAASEWLTLKGSGIEGPEDMRGRVWSTAGIGNTGFFAFRQWLRDHGVADDEYDVIENPFPLQEEILRAGEGDIGEFVPPFTINALESGEFEVVISAVDLIGEWAGLVNVFRQDFADEHPEVVEAFMEDWVEVANFVRDPANKDEVIRSTSEVTEVPEEALDFLLTRDDFFRPEDGRVDVKRLQAVWDLFYEWGALDEPLSAEDHVWPGWLE